MPRSTRWLALSVIALACRPTPKPPPAPSDTTVVVHDSTPPDSTALTDTMSADTISHEVAPATVADTVHGPLMPRAAPTGMPFGATKVPTTEYGRLTATDIGTSPNNFLPLVRAAATKGVAIVLNMPRTSQTANGQVYGYYSVRNTWAAIDQLARAVPRDSVVKYTTMGVLRGYRIMDDMGCTHCWGRDGNVVSSAQVDSVYTYARAHLPAELPLGIRVHPTWLKGRTPGASVARNIDFFYAMWYENMGDQQTWYTAQATYAKTLGTPPPRIIYAVTWLGVRSPADETPLSADKAKRYGTVAINFPGNCMVSGYRYFSGWRDAGRGVVWDALVQAARAKTGVPSTCRRSLH